MSTSLQCPECDRHAKDNGSDDFYDIVQDGSNDIGRTFICNCNRAIAIVQNKRHPGESDCETHRWRWYRYDATAWYHKGSAPSKAVGGTEYQTRQIIYHAALIARGHLPGAFHTRGLISTYGLCERCGESFSLDLSDPRPVLLAVPSCKGPPYGR